MSEIRSIFVRNTYPSTNNTDNRYCVSILSLLFRYNIIFNKSMYIYKCTLIYKLLLHPVAPHSTPSCAKKKMPAIISAIHSLS